MMIHIDRNGERMGPYSLEDVNRYLADGTLQPSDLGWYDGATDWAPLTNIEGVVAAGAAPPPTSGSTCPNCRIPVEANQVVCVECGTRLKEAPVAGGGKGSKTVLIAVGSVVLIAGIVLGVMQPWKKDKGDSVGPVANGGGEPKKPSPPDVDEPKKPSPPDVDIFKAAGDGNLNALKQHIAAGTDLDQRFSDDQSTPLMIAALFGRTEAAKALIEAGAKLDLKKNDGGTALMNAAFFCHTEVVQALLDKGADKNITNNTGSTPLQAVEAPLPLVNLIYSGLDEAIFKPAGMPLDMERIKATRPKIAKMLGGSGGNVSGNNEQAMDIFGALTPGNEEALKKQIASGADLNVKGPLGTPLNVAAIYGNTASAMLLINGGADVNAPAPDGNTALHSAAFFCHPEIVKALLAKGANVNARNAKGETPLSSFALPWPAAQGIYQLVGGILQMPMGPAELQRIQNTRPQIAQILRQAGAQ